MSFNIGELVGYITLDDTQFQSKVNATGNSLQSLGRTATTVGHTVAAGLTLGVGAATTMGVALVKAGAGYNVLQQNSRAALKTVLGSTQAVNEQMAKLDALASKSPFSKAVFIEGQQQLLAFGMAAEKVVPTLDAIQNAVAATGGSSQQLSDLTFVIAQIQAAGKITGQDLMQMGQRGVDAAGIIGSQMGMTGAEIRESITKGALSAEQALDALTMGLQAKFGGATDNIKQQWSGAADRIKAAWRDTGAVIAQPFIDPNGGGQAVVWGNLVADTMRSVQKHVTRAMTVVKAEGGPAFDTITRGLQKANEAVSRFNLDNALRQISTLSKFTPLIAGVGGAVVAMGAKSLPVISSLAGGLNPLVAGAIALGATSPKLREVGAAFTSSLAPAAPALQQVAIHAGMLANEAISRLAPGLKRVAEGAGDTVPVLVNMAGVAVDLAGALLPLVEAGVDLVAWAAKLPAPLLAGAAAIALLHQPLGTARGMLVQLGTSLATAAGDARTFMAASRQVAAETGMSTTMAAAKGAASSLGDALAGLLTPANLVGVGLTVLTGLIATYIARQAEARQKAQEFAGTLDETTGALTDQTQAFLVNELQATGLIAAYERIGGNAKDLTDKYMGNAQAAERVASTMAEASEKADNLSTESGDLYQESIDLSEALRVLERNEYKVSDAVEAGTRVAEEKRRATLDNVDATRREVEALDALLDAQRKQAAANGDLVAAQYATKDAMTRLSEAAASQGEIARDTSGGIDLMADANRGMVESTMSVVDSINRQMDAYIKTGATQDQVAAKFESLTGGLYGQLEAFGIVGEEAEAFAASLGLIPEHKSVVVDMTVDDEAARVDLDQLIKDTQNSEGTITVLADSNPAVDRLATTLGMVKTSEGTFALNANEDPAAAKLLATLATVDSSKGTFTIDGANDKAMAALNEAIRQVNAGQGTITINGIDYATNEAYRAQQRINGLSAYIQVYAQTHGTSAGLIADTFADGGLVNSQGVKYFANGGSERHVAQIAPAGAWRVWAEPETGGEAYVPLAASKRRRSQQIMAEVARTFGDLYIPASASRYADGAAPTASSMSSGPSDILVRVTVTNPFTAEEVEETVRGEIVSVLRQVG